MTRKIWLKEFQDCQYKFTDAQRKTRGNVLCAQFITGTRCTYRICPLRSASLQDAKPEKG